MSGEYGKENDIFMLGTAIWQTFRISELAGRDPLASRRDFAPCANIEKQQVSSQRLCCAADCYMVQGTVKLLYKAFSENNSWVQNPNTNRFKRTLIYFNTDTQYAHFRGNPLYQATKRHLNNR